MKTHKQSDLLVASVVGLEGGRITRVLFDTTSCVSHLQVKVAIPGASQISVCLYSHRDTWDSISFDEGVHTEDELLGMTHIDVEQRWFCDEWKKEKSKPVEHRALWHPKSPETPVGYCSLWVEIHRVEDAKRLPPLERISLEAVKREPYEVRFIVWKAKDIPPQEDDPTGLIGV